MAMNKGRAERLARAIASDISIYNQKEIKLGVEEDTLFEQLEGELSEGAALFKNKVGEEMFNNTNIFEKAIVDIIFAAQTEVHSKIF